ncbi:MAG: hypothetical protein IKW17_05100 [Paludibacteraceae bacterium]|nr:hypothetical protein [Paludibacteraceae bacterium]
MKKIYFGIVTLAVMLFVTACSQNEPQQDEALVTFSVGVEDANITRAYSDGTTANQLIYSIFNENGTKVIISKVTENNLTDLLEGHTVTVSLAKGHTYTAVFWAQNSACKAYTISEDMHVTIDYTGLNNDETRDAFFAASEPFTVNNNLSQDVILKRPFAQVNVGAYEYDYTYAKENKLNVTLSSATITDVPSVINLYDGSVSQPVNVEYTLNNIPTGDNEKLHVDVNQDGEKEYYRYLSMCYILADPVGSTHTMSFKFKDIENDKLVGFSEGLENVPAKRNWRTNLVGQILTGPANFLVIIDPTYNGEINLQ